MIKKLLFLMALNVGVMNYSLTSDKIQEILDPSKFYIFLDGEINSKKVVPIIQSLAEYYMKDPSKEIVFFIDSVGGCVQSAFTIINLMLSITNPIRTVVVNKAYSAAYLIFLAGNKGLRTISKMATLMIHKPKFSFKSRDKDFT